MNKLKTLLCIFGLIYSLNASANWEHIVDEDTRTLGEIGIFCYGRALKANDIAAWNSLTPPFHLKLKQKIVLIEKPTLTPKEGRARLLEMWKKQFGLPISLPPQQEEIPTLEIATEEVVKIKTPEELINEANSILDQNPVEALRLLEEALTKNEKLLSAWFLKLKLLKQTQNYKDLEKAYSLLIKIQPTLKNLRVLKDYQKFIEQKGGLLQK